MSLLDAAIQYAELGYRVIQLHHVRDDDSRSCSCGKTDCTRSGKHPVGGKGWQDRATNDPDYVRELWNSRPEANIGIVTGNGLLVIDIDGAVGELTPSPATHCSRSGHGGLSRTQARVHSPAATAA